MKLNDYQYPIVSRLSSNNTHKSTTTLSPLIKDKGEMYPDKPFVNYKIYRDNIFCLTYDNHKYRNVEFIENASDAITNYNKYYIEVNPNKNFHIRPKGEKSYIFNNSKLLLDNYKAVALRDRPIFNYDFVVLENEIFLLLHLQNDFFFYKASNVNNLSNSEWDTQHCIQVPFKQEYFMVVSNNDGTYTIRTQSQGEYKLTQFKNNPTIIKINNESLSNKIFIEDRRSGVNHQLTPIEFKKIKSSTDHTKALEKVLKNK